MPARTILLGVGNPILSDDRVGLIVAEEVEKNLNERLGKVPDWLTIDCAVRGGLEFVEKLAGFERAIIVDSIKTGMGDAGSIFEFSSAELMETEHFTSYHGVNFATAMKLGEELGIQMPKEIRIFAIEILENEVVSEEVNEAVLQSGKMLAHRLAKELAC